MYIGPWQEYNLSKNRSRPPAASSSIKRGLEEAIANSLDPLAAQAALAAVETFFSSQQPQPQPQPQQLPPIHAMSPQRPAHQRPARHGRGGRKHLPALTYRNLVEAERTVNSARELTMSDSTSSLGSAPSPMSVRSTQSEPTPSGLRLPAISMTSNQMQLGITVPAPVTVSSSSGAGAVPVLSPQRPMLQPIDISHRPQAPSQPVSGYNASAVVSFMRMERAQKTRAALDKVTGWRRPEPAPNPAVDRAKEKRLEQVSTMRATYLSGVKGQGVEFSDSLSPGVSREALLPDLQADTIAEEEESRPSTPEVKAINLTDHELQMVSKYFQPSSSGVHLMPDQDSRSNSISSTVPTGIGIADISPVRSALGSPVRAESSMGSMDELYVGGIDGLLKWSSQLDLDMLS